MFMVLPMGSLRCVYNNYVQGVFVGLGIEVILLNVACMCIKGTNLIWCDELLPITFLLSFRDVG